MSTPLLRHWAMLRLVPRHPKKIDAPSLCRMLDDEGYPIDLRSVQRDLQKLSAVFPLVGDEHRPQGWSWEKSAPPFDVPGMDPHTAIAFRLVEQQLAHQLPRTTLDVLRPHFKLSDAVLKGLRKSGLPSWGDKVRAVPRGQALMAPKVAAPVLTAVYDALLEERKLELRYRRRSDGQVTDGEVNPLGLVYRDSLPYLVCTWWDYDDVRQLALPRVEKAAMLEDRRRAPKGFNLQTYVEAGETSMLLSKKPIRLVARFHPDAAASVTETPLAADQTETVDDDGWVRVEARVADTRVLRGWLLSFGGLVEVVAPKAVREGTVESLRGALGVYRD